MKMRRRKGIAGIVATIIMFAILFTVGTSYFVFVSSQNTQFSNSLAAATNSAQGRIGESLQITTLLTAAGNVAFYANNTSGSGVNMRLPIVATRVTASL